MGKLIQHIRRTSFLLIRLAVKVVLLINILTGVHTGYAQDVDQSKKSNFKDSVDGKLDLGKFLVEAHGFIPIPQIITEPALGHFGLMFTLIFVKPNKVQVQGKYTPPDITAAFVGLTANKSWGTGVLRTASLPKHHLKYRIGGGYGHLNMDYYRTFPSIGEKTFAFNFKLYGLQSSLLRQIGKSNWYAGLDYLFLHNKVDPLFGLENSLAFVDDKVLDATLSSVGLDVELDKRNSVFTPDSGLYFASDFGVNAPWTGSDYEFQLLNLYAFQYFQVTPTWVSGFRFESHHVWGDVPFYSMPSISLRGVPAARYQGTQTYVLETEQRYDLTLRWSAVVFIGMGKAPTEEISLTDAKLVYNYGAGFRYLLARRFRLRTGIDVAGSNDDFGWYIVFGSAWNKRS